LSLRRCGGTATGRRIVKRIRRRGRTGADIRKTLNLKCAAAWLGISAAAAAAADRPNIVMLMTDDQGVGDVGCYGSDRVKTPNLDRLAAEGIRFTRFYAPASSCSPTRAGIMTGRSPLRLGIYTYIPGGSTMHVKRGERTIGSILRDGGYATCFVGKWALNGSLDSKDQPQPGDHGFDHWLAAQNNATPSHLNPDCFFRNGQPMGVMTGYSARIIVDEAIGWLKGRKGDQRPFCLFVWFQEPHRVIATPPEFSAPYRGRVPDGAPSGGSGGLSRGQKEAPTTADYLGNIAHVDHQVGRLMATLADLGIERDTLVMFTSDNGPIEPGSTGGLRGGKGTLWEGGIRMPGILRWPSKVAAGRTCDVPVTGLDLLPTICAIAGAPAPADRVLDGESILPLLEGRPFQRTKPLFWWRLGGDAVLREGDWKLCGTPEKAKDFASPMDFIKRARLTTFALYNLADDPAETADIAAGNADRVEAMSRRLREVHGAMQAEAEAWTGRALPKSGGDGKGGPAKAASRAKKATEE